MDDVRVLESIQRRVLWLSTLMVHDANRARPDSGGIKVGGHQASSSSVVSILTALFFDFMRAPDRVAIKPHASPAFHACQYLLGNLDRRYLTELRAFQGLQAYPSRTKDPDPVDFSTGSVGLGSVAPNFAALVDRYVRDHFEVGSEEGRFISVLGDAELDEGSVWEALAEPALDGLSNVIWIIDLNRQSLDRIVPGIRAERLRDMFRANGWEVIDAKYGRALEGVFARSAGERLRSRIDGMPNDEYQRILRAPPEELRARLTEGDARLGRLLTDYSDGEIARLVADLGGHDLAVLRGALKEADKASDPAVVFAYTIKGWGLPIAGDPLNHSALLSSEQMKELQRSLGIPEGGEYEAFPSDSPEGRLCRAARARLARPPIRDRAREMAIPSDLGVKYPPTVSSQRAFSLALADLARAHADVIDRVVTASPDVATSTNLGGWINRRGVYALSERPDPFADAGPRILRWSESPSGSHIELGISENNLFLLLGMLGLSDELFGEILLPIGTLYDPFIARGLDALIYGLYSGSRFLFVATPSGITLSPEGGAHQSVVTPSIGIELPELTMWEPCFAVETEWVLLEALREVARRDIGTSSYIRLSTKPVDQSAFPEGVDREALRARVLSGAHRIVDRSGEPRYRPGENVVVVAAAGALVPEAMRASEYLLEDEVFVDVVSVTSPGRLYRSFQESILSEVDRAAEGRRTGDGWEHPAFGRELVPVVTVLDGHPHTLAWLPAALGRAGVPLGVTGFGRSGTVDELYRRFRIDRDAIVAACLVALQGGP